jgi:hypothetical protein
MKRNSFINAALEELNKEVATDAQASTTIAEPADGAANTTLTEVNLDQSVDAVAALMAKNASLQDQNASLEAECFDSDMDIVDTSSDTVQKDLAEAVSACEAFAELANLASLTVKSNQANAASVASLMFGLEQISLRAGVKSPVSALEDSAVALYNPATGKDSGATSEEASKAQAGAVAKSAMEKVKEIGKKLMDGIKRIVGWIINVLRQFFTYVGGLPDRIQKAAKEYDQIDESVTIDSAPFIASLRLVEGGGDPNKQFENYAAMASKTLYGFFGDNFVNHMREAFSSLQTPEDGQAYNAGMDKLDEVIRVALSTIYTVDSKASDIPNLSQSDSSEEWTVGKTVPCIGGVQLYLAGKTGIRNTIWQCKSGLVTAESKFDVPESIPVVKKDLADKMFGTITKWLRDQKDLEHKLQTLLNLKWNTTHTSNEGSSKAIYCYLSVLTAIATGSMPHLLRMNVHNSINFVAYVEKSIAVSKASYTKKK